MKVKKPIYAGPIMDKVAFLPRHCETIMRNSDCPYIQLGCKGCTISGYEEVEFPELSLDAALATRPPKLVLDTRNLET